MLCRLSALPSCDKLIPREVRGVGQLPYANSNSVWTFIQATMVQFEIGIIQVSRVDELPVALIVLSGKPGVLSRLRKPLTMNREPAGVPSPNDGFRFLIEYKHERESSGSLQEGEEGPQIPCKDNGERVHMM